MKRTGISLGILAMLCLAIAAPAAAQSLGDVARAQKDAKTKKPAKVYTNDDFPSGNTSPVEPTTEKESSTIAPNSTSETPTLPALNRQGESVQVPLEPGTDMLFMATWCPHSKALKDIVNDPRTRPYLEKHKLIFVFSRNEWGRVQSELEDMAKSGKIAESKIPAVLEKMKHDAGSPYVTDPKFLDDLPGDYYFAFRPKEVTGYPTVLSTRGYSNRSTWLLNELKIPVELYSQLENEYDPGK